jgi:hypothetical protein
MSRVGGKAREKLAGTLIPRELIARAEGLLSRLRAGKSSRK